MLFSATSRRLGTAMFVIGLVAGKYDAASAGERFEVVYKKTAQDADGVQWIGAGAVNGPGSSHDVGIEAIWPVNARRQAGNAILVSQFFFHIWDESFENLLVVFEMKGIINANNGKIVFNGEVVESQAPDMRVGSKAQLRAQASEAFDMTMGSVMVTVP